MVNLDLRGWLLLKKKRAAGIGTTVLRVYQPLRKVRTSTWGERSTAEIAFYIRQRLSDSQRQWLAIQSDALDISSEQIMSDVLSEWFIRHWEAEGNGYSLGDFLPEALEEFVS